MAIMNDSYFRLVGFLELGKCSLITFTSRCVQLGMMLPSWKVTLKCKGISHFDFKNSHI